MRCKKHYSDLSSTVGVCATCLRQRLSAILAAQAQLQAEKPAQDDSWRSDTIQQQQQFPRSVSPYISRRKSDTTTTTASADATWKQNQLFNITRQLGSTVEIKNSGKKSNRGRSISKLIWGFFRSKSIKSDSVPNSNPLISVDNCRASPSWYSTMIGASGKKQSRTFSIDETIPIGKTCRNRERGMSPDEEHFHGGLSGYSSESEGWKQTPRRTPAAQRGSGKATGRHSRNVSGFTFCLSPLVRASPNVQRNPETVVNGEARVPPKPHLSYAASFCKSRSRKLADFGRYNYNSNY